MVLDNTMKSQSMLSRESLTKCRQNIIDTLSQFDIKIHSNTKLIMAIWNRNIIFIADSFSEHNSSTHYTARWNSYLGWKIYMRLTGCFGSIPEMEKELEQGRNIKL